MKKPTKAKLYSTINALKYQIQLMHLVNKTEFIEKMKEPHPSFNRAGGKNEILQEVINKISKKY